MEGATMIRPLRTAHHYFSMGNSSSRVGGHLSSNITAANSRTSFIVHHVCNLTVIISHLLSWLLQIGWLVSGVFTIAATVISFWLMNKHLQWYTNVSVPSES